MDISLHGSIFMFSDKVKLAACLLNNSPSHPLHLIPSTPTNWPINEFNVNKLNWRQHIPCHNIHIIYSTSIIWTEGQCHSFLNFLLYLFVWCKWIGKLNKTKICKWKKLYFTKLKLEKDIKLDIYVRLYWILGSP